MLLTVCQLVYNNDAILVGEHHNAEDRGGYDRHGIHITLTKEYIVVQLGVQEFNVYKDRLSS